MRNLIPVLTLAGTLALATTASATADCAALLGPMAGIMQSARMGAGLSPVEHQTWREWNASCKERGWQDQLAQTLPGGPPAPMVVEGIYAPATAPDPIPSLTWRDYALAALQGFERGITAPVTTCRTTYAHRKGRGAYYTTCNTYGGY